MFLACGEEASRGSGTTKACNRSSAPPRNAAKQAQDEFRRSGGSLQLIGEDALGQVVGRGGTRLVVYRGASQQKVCSDIRGLTLNPKSPKA